MKSIICHTIGSASKFMLMLLLIISFLGQKQVFSQTTVSVPDPNLASHLRYLFGLQPTDPILESHMQTLTYLDINNMNITNLTGLETAVNLDTLIMYNHKVNSFAPLSGLSTLLYLDIGQALPTVAYNAATVLSFTANMTGLRYLDISTFKSGVNLAPLSGHANLRTLIANYNPNADISGLGNLPVLETLRLVSCYITDITSLSALTSLRYLNLSGNKIDNADLPALYTLDRLQPTLYLMYNGVGFFPDSIQMLCDELDSISNVFDIEYISNSKFITVGLLRIRAAEIDTIGTEKYVLGGTIQIQNEVVPNLWKPYFTASTMYVDRSLNLYEPFITGTGLRVFNLSPSTGAFKFTIKQKSLIPDEPLDGNFDLDGFVPHFGKYVLSALSPGMFKVTQDFALLDVPYPYDKIIQYLVFQNEQDSLSGNILPMAIGGSDILIYDEFNDSTSEQVNLNVNLSAFYNFGLFALSDITLNYAGDTLSGGFRIKVPGMPSAPDISGKMDAAHLGKYLTDAFESKPEIVSVYKEVPESDESKGNDKAPYSPFLDLTMKAELTNGSLNAISCAFGVDVPLGTTGLKLTSVMAGVDDLQNKNWRMQGTVDIETGLSVGVLGPVVSLVNVGVSFGPENFFEASGNAKVFGWDVGSAKILYNHNKGALSLGGQINIDDILRGGLHSSIRLNKFNGSVLGSLKLPDNLPWKFNSLSGLNVGSVYGQINGLSILSEVNAFDALSLAARIDYGNPSFPYIYFYLGQNMEELYHIFKSTTVQNFSVPPNTSKLLVVAGNDNNLFDFTLSAPNGVTYNALNTVYQQSASAKQSIMVVSNPPSGYWAFNTAQTGAITLSVDAVNQPPAGYFIKPMQPLSTSDTIKFVFSDYLDTLTLSLYYDNDNKDFDGTLIQKYENIINGYNLTDIWNWNVPSVIPDGEYFIYAIVEDGKNAPRRYYATGSILVSHSSQTLAPPQNFSALPVNDSIQLNWDVSPDTNVVWTEIFITDLAENTVDKVVVTDTNTVFVTNVLPGKTYSMWSRFTTYNNTQSAPSATVTVGMANTVLNNPPYFVNNNETWLFEHGAPATYPFNVMHLGNGNLTYALIGDTLGFILQQNQVTWTPQAWHSGNYILTVVVTDDSAATDTLYQNIFVMPDQQAQVSVSFNSPMFFSGGGSFLIVNDNSVDTSLITAQLKNLRTGQEILFTCYRSDETTFTGYFSATGTFTGLADGDTIRATYVSEGTTYTAFTRYCQYAMGTQSAADAGNSINLYPNPNNGVFCLQIENAEQQKVIWDVFSIGGSYICGGHFNGQSEEIELGNISNGNYIMLLRIGNTIAYKRFVVLEK